MLASGAPARWLLLLPSRPTTTPARRPRARRSCPAGRRGDRERRDRGRQRRLWAAAPGKSRNPPVPARAALCKPRSERVSASPADRGWSPARGGLSPARGGAHRWLAPGRARRRPLRRRVSSSPVSDLGFSFDKTAQLDAGDIRAERSLWQKGLSVHRVYKHPWTPPAARKRHPHARRL